MGCFFIVRASLRFSQITRFFTFAPRRARGAAPRGEKYNKKRSPTVILRYIEDSPSRSVTGTAQHIPTWCRVGVVK